MSALVETAQRCPECGFDPGRWRVRDVRDLLAAMPSWWAGAMGRPGGTPRPDAGRREDLAGLRDRSLALAGSPVDAPDGVSAPAGALRVGAAHETRHLMMEASRRLAPLRAPRTGSVVQVSVSGGGVPKRPVDRVAVGWDGLGGDGQTDTKHHGRPFQAVCLWSAEVIDGFRREGHSLGPGSAGENLTIAGLPWDEMGPGVLVQAGACRMEVSFPATPCGHQAQWFSDGDFSRISHDENPGHARWYAWVCRPGPVAPGDPVLLGDAALLGP